jgi:hypothetical protein
MKRLFVIFFILASFCSSGQTPTFRWVKKIPFEIKSQCSDDEDNVYIAGELYDTTIFENNTLYFQNGEVVIAKFDSTGSLLWYCQLGGPINNSSVALERDQNNDVVIVNSFNYSTIYYGDSIIAQGHDAVLTKLSKNGDLIWYEVPGYNDTGCLHVFTSAVDQENNIFISGDLQWGGNGIFGDTIIPTNGVFVDVIAKYNSDGYFQWVRKSDDVFNQIIADHSNNILIFSDTIQKYSSNNTLIWEKPSSVNFPVTNFWPKVATDSLDNAYISTWFYNPFYIGNDTLTPMGSSHFIYVKLNSSGIPILTKLANSTKGFSPNSISIYKNKVGITGTFKDNLFIDNDSLKSVTDKNNNSFIALYDLDGNLQFIKKIDGANGCSSQIISVSKSIYVSGIFNDTIYFDNISITNDGQYTSGCFLARLQNEVIHPLTYPETLELFPNPAHGSLTIKMNPSYKNAILEIYDIQGKLTDMYILDTNSLSINIDHLSKGFYFVKVRTNEKTFINKFEKI